MTLTPSRSKKHVVLDMIPHTKKSLIRVHCPCFTPIKYCLSGYMQRPSVAQVVLPSTPEAGGAKFDPLAWLFFFRFSFYVFAWPCSSFAWLACPLGFAWLACPLFSVLHGTAARLLFCMPALFCLACRCSAPLPALISFYVVMPALFFLLCALTLAI